MKKIIQMFNETSFENDVIYYGFQVLLFNILAVILTIVISCIADLLYLGICFIFCFACFRIPAGGFHCKKPLNCIALMGLVFSLVMYLSKYILIPNYILILFINIIIFRSLLNNQKHIFVPSLLMVGCSMYTQTNYSILAVFYAYLIFQICYYIPYHKLY